MWRRSRYVWRNFGAVYQTAPVSVSKMAQFVVVRALPGYGKAYDWLPP
jgi:hypothetical protein